MKRSKVLRKQVLNGLVDLVLFRFVLFGLGVFGRGDRIRTCVPVKANGFQDRPGMTASVPLLALLVGVPVAPSVTPPNIIVYHSCILFSSYL